MLLSPLAFDCPILDNLLDLCLDVAGSSISGAEALASKEVDVVINWFGGWHHSQRDSAAGFCYVNDIVLAIHKLRKTFKKVLYIDLDVHHGTKITNQSQIQNLIHGFLGDGVENAFLFSNKVFTLSLHLKEAGFYPGTGSSSNVGLGKGKYFCMNVPLKEGTSDDLFYGLFKR